MKKQIVFTLLFAFSALLLSANPGNCSLVLSAGDEFSLEFTSLPYSYSDYSDGLLAFATVSASSAISAYSTFTFSVYEDSLLESPIRSTTAGVDPNFGVQGQGFLVNSNLAPWQDMQGILYVKVLSGSITLESFTAATLIENNLYQQSFAAVPIPSSLLLIVSGLSMLCVVRRKKQ